MALTKEKEQMCRSVPFNLPEAKIYIQVYFGITKVPRFFLDKLDRGETIFFEISLIKEKAEKMGEIVERWGDCSPPFCSFTCCWVFFAVLQKKLRKTAERWEQYAPKLSCDLKLGCPIFFSF